MGDWDWEYFDLSEFEIRRRHPINKLVCKHQMQFAKYFLPKHVYSVQLAYCEDDETLHVVGRVKPHHQSTKGKTQLFEIEMSKFNVWKKNVGLYTFISSKSD